MFLGNKAPGWISTAEFYNLADQYTRDTDPISLREFIEKVYENYAKVRGRKIDLDKIEKGQEFGTKEQKIILISVEICLESGFIEDPEPESTRPKSITELRDEMIKAKNRDDTEGMWKIFLKFMDITALEITLLEITLIKEKQNRSSPWQSIGK